jgi:hypothetical protein
MWFYTSLNNLMGLCPNLGNQLNLQDFDISLFLVQYFHHHHRSTHSYHHQYQQILLNVLQVVMDKNKGQD